MKEKAKLGTKTKGPGPWGFPILRGAGTSSRAPWPWDLTRGSPPRARIPREIARKPPVQGTATPGARPRTATGPCCSRVQIGRQRRAPAPRSKSPRIARASPLSPARSVIGHSPSLPLPRAATASPIKGPGRVPASAQALISSIPAPAAARSSGFSCVRPPPPDLRRGGGERLGRPGESEIELRGRHSDGGRSRRGQRSTRGEGDHAAACKKFSSRRGSIEEDVHGRRRRAGEEGLARHRRAPRPPPKDRYVRLLPACL
jgi:hypothetical protein